jgi:hypothetical protein
MLAPVAHRALQYLLRSSGTPEVTTNNTLQALLDADRTIAEGFLDALSVLAERDVRGCSIQRESYLLNPTSGKSSYRDFALVRDGEVKAIIETKIDSALTSEDQASRYFGQLSIDGLFVLVTREPLMRSLAAQAGQQLQLPLHEQNGLYRGVSGERTVLVTSWGRLLRQAVSPVGEPFEDLLALAAAIEGISDFVPFTTTVEDTAVGKTVAQVSTVAHKLCGGLAERLDAKGVRYDWVSRTKQRSYAAWVVVSVLGHEFWLGYDADYWATTPGDPEHFDAGPPTAAAPSPFWVNRYVPDRADSGIAEQRRKRLDNLGIARPLQVPLGAPEGAVVDSLLEQAVAQVRRISDALYSDPELVAAAAQEDSDAELALEDRVEGEELGG